MSAPLEHSQPEPIWDMSLPTNGQKLVSRAELSQGYWPVAGENPYLLVGGSEAIRQVMGDTETFAPDNALTAVTPLEPASLRILLSYGFSLPEVLASAKGQLHRSVRKVVTSFFTPQKVRAQEEGVRARTRAALAAWAPGAGQLPVFHLLPVALMQELTGVPRQDYLAQGLDEAELARYSLDSLELFWGWVEPEHQQELAHRAGEFHRKLSALVAGCAERPETLFGALASQKIESKRIVSLAYFLAIAGQYTTCLLMNSILHAGVTGQWGITLGQCADFSRAQELVRAALQAESSVPTWRRVATADSSVGGCPVHAGQEVLLEVSGPQSDDYRMAFGWGAHRCLGALLAESECTWMLHELACWLEHEKLSLHLAEEPRWLDLLSYRAPLELKFEVRNEF